MDIAKILSSKKIKYFETNNDITIDLLIFINIRYTRELIEYTFIIKF